MKSKKGEIAEGLLGRKWLLGQDRIYSGLLPEYRWRCY